MWEKIIEHGRLAQWIVCGGGIMICIAGIITEQATFQDITVIFLAVLAAAFGLKNSSD